MSITEYYHYPVATLTIFSKPRIGIDHINDLTSELETAALNSACRLAFFFPYFQHRTSSLFHEMRETVPKL